VGAAPADTMEAILSQEAADEDEDERSGDEEGGRATRRAQRQKKKRDGSAAWLEEAPDEIVDLQDSRTLSRLHSSRTHEQKLLSGTAADAASKDGLFPLAADGRMLILDEGANAEGDSEDEDEHDDFMEDDMEDECGDAKAGTGGGGLSLGSTAVEEPGLVQYAPGGRGIHRPLTGPGSTGKAAAAPRKLARPGAEFSAKRAGGDMKRGAVNPYSYVEINRSRLNRRNVKGRQDALAQFRMLTKATRGATGGASGLANAVEAATGGKKRQRGAGGDARQSKSGKRKRIH